jgi:hypothetical protein
LAKVSDFGKKLGEFRACFDLTKILIYCFKKGKHLLIECHKANKAHLLPKFYFLSGTRKIVSVWQKSKAFNFEPVYLASEKFAYASSKRTNGVLIA